jgi:hypothetical protein
MSGGSSGSMLVVHPSKEPEMTVDTTGFQKAHREIGVQVGELRDLARRLPELTERQRSKERSRIVRYLRERVDPHTELDERLLYPAVAVRLGDALFAVSMTYDHLAIRHWISKLAAADVTDTARLQQLLYGLDALIRTHMWKENELFLAALESPAWPNSG